MKWMTKEVIISTIVCFVTFDQTLIIQSSSSAFSTITSTTITSTSIAGSRRRRTNHLFHDGDFSTSTIGIPKNEQQTSLFLIPSKFIYVNHYDSNGDSNGNDNSGICVRSLTTSSSTSLSLTSSSASSPSSPSRKQSSRKAMENLQRRLTAQTLLRIAIPSLSAALVCYITFPPITNAIYDYVATAFNGVETGTGYEALNLILTDNSNQFIQNAHNFFALNFCFLFTSTFSFLYNNQVKLYNSLFEEVSLLGSLLEQIALSTEGRVGVYRLLLLSVRKYVNEELMVVTNLSERNRDILSASNSGIDSDSGSESGIESGSDFNRSHTTISREDLPSHLISKRPQKDPLETILYLTSVGQPSYIYSTIKSLRQARAVRLASIQRKLPELNMYLLYITGLFAWITFPIVTAGSFTVGGETLIEVYRYQLSLGLFGMGLVLGIINELKQPEVGSAYNVDYSVLGTLIDGIEEELDYRLSKCEGDGVGNSISSMNNGSLNSYDEVENVIMNAYDGGEWSRNVLMDNFDISKDDDNDYNDNLDNQRYGFDGDRNGNGDYKEDDSGIDKSIAANHEFTSSYDNSEEIKNAAPGLRKRIVDKIKRRKKSR
jgi:hypothetical protein